MPRITHISYHSPAEWPKTAILGAWVCIYRPGQPTRTHYAVTDASLDRLTTVITLHNLNRYGFCYLAPDGFSWSRPGTQPAERSSL